MYFEQFIHSISLYIIKMPLSELMQSLLSPRVCKYICAMIDRVSGGGGHQRHPQSHGQARL